MFRYINAWLRAVFRYITACLQAAADDSVLQAPTEDRDADASPQAAAVDFSVTVSLGPLNRLLHSLKALKSNVADGISEAEIQRLKEDLVRLFTELKNVSEAKDPSFTAKCWMKEVRELCYDAEDYFNEVVRSGECDGAGAGAGVRRSALLSFIFWVPSKLMRRSQIRKDFSDLWARVKDASQRRQSFQLDTVTSRLEFGQADVSRVKPELSLQLLEEPMKKLVKLLDLDEEIAELLAFGIEDVEEQVQVVPIFGFAGVGKTTLAETFYRNYGGKFQCRSFVRVSRNPNMRRLLSSILSQIRAPPVHGFYDVQDLIDGIRKHLQGKRYLIIIDDLWASSTWDIISRSFPDGDCCSRIIVTTEIENVALACCRYQLKDMYEMSPLNGDQSMKLFLGRVFGSENGCPTDFREVAYGIIRKSGGLPLATVNIASMLATEPNLEQWKHIRDSLPSALSLRTNPSLEGLKEVLNIIYNNLSPQLKTCLIYLIMYPEGYTIRKDELVKQWVVEDFVGEGQDREKIAGEYFDELVSRGMIQPIDRNYNDEVLTCTVHHMVLDLIRYKSLEDNFIINVGCSQTNLGLPDKVRRLSTQFGSAKCANIPAGFLMSQLRSLMFFGFFNCLPSIADYKLLRVLVLHIWADQHKIFDLTRVDELFRLRYLKIECNITVHLPGEIGRLKFLETLELPAHVENMPSDISCLPCLRTLGYFNLSKNSIENVQSLGELNSLQDLHLTCSNTAEPDNLKSNMRCLGSILWKLSSLKSLTLVPAASSHADVLDDAGGESVGVSNDGLGSMSSPPAFLQRLELSGRCCIFSSLPEWISELGKLCILKIAVKKLLRKDIDILKGLPALTALSLSVWTVPVGKIVFDNEGFSVLKYFKFICAAPCVAFLEGAMPTLREFTLGFDANRMKQYSQIGAGAEYLTELRDITANVGGNGANESDRTCAVLALKDAIANHPRTPIIRVQCVEWIFHGEDTSTQEQEHWTLEIQHEIQEELHDPPRELISTPSTQTETRDGGQNEGTDRSIEVLTQEQEQEHWTPENRQGIPEEFLDLIPELLSTPSTQAQTRDGVQGEQVEISMEVVAQEQVKHELQEQLLDHLPDLVSTPSTQTKMRDRVQNAEIGRSMAVVTQEQEKEHCTPEKHQEIEKKLLDPLPELLSVPSTQTQTRNVMQNRGTERSLGVVSACGADEFDKRYLESTLSGAIDNHPNTPVIRVQCVDQILYGEEDTSTFTKEQERWTMEKPHEIQEESLNPLSELLITTPSTQTETRDEEQKEGTDRSMQVLIQEQEQEQWTPAKIQGIQEEFPDLLPELLSTPSTQTQTRDGVQGEQIERSMEVVSQEHIEHEIQEELLDHIPDSVSTPSMQTKKRDRVPNAEIERSREHWTLEQQHEIQERFLVGVGTGVMKPLLFKLSKMLEEEYSKLKGVRREVESTRDEMSSMKVALEALADAEQLDTKMIAWRDDVRELSYDVEDCLDDFMSRANHDGPKGLKGFIGKLKKLKPNHEIARQIKELKARAIEASKRHKRYKFDYPESDSITCDIDPRLQALFVDVGTLIGINGPKEHIIEWFKNHDSSTKLRVVSIIGLGGLGKTTLAIAVFDTIKSEFSCAAFVSLSRKPNMKNVLRAIARNVGITDNTQNYDELRLIDRLRDHLQDKKYLIVVDDVWSTEAWRTIRDAMLNNDHGSRIITTTRNSTVASFCSSQGDYVHRMKPLSFPDSRRLFLGRAFRSEDLVPPHLIEVSERILGKCEGLPLAIITMSSLLADETAVEKWKRVLAAIGSSLAYELDADNMTKILSLSYFDLPQPMRSCFLYLSAYPEDHIIEKQSLIHKWIAEGFIRAYEVGESYFNDFINRSLIQPANLGDGQADYGQVLACRVHIIILHFIKCKAKEENFMTSIGNVEQGNKHKVRRLSVVRCSNEMDTVLGDLSHVRSLAVFGYLRQNSALDFPALRVLDLGECLDLQDKHMENIEKLLLLKYLRLGSDSDSVIDIPRGFGKLKYLETLDMHGICVRELPSTMTHLQRLARLYADFKPTCLSDGIIGQLASLEEIENVEVLELGKFLQELGRLTKLRTLSVTVKEVSDSREKEDVVRFVGTLISSYNIRHLRISYGAFGTAKDPLSLESWCPANPAAFRKIWLDKCYIEKVPTWMLSLVCLHELDLLMYRTGPEDVAILGEIPVLAFLKLETFCGRNRELFIRGFRRLKCFRVVLRFCGTAVVFEEGSMPQLEHVELEFKAHKMKCVNYVSDFGIQHLSALTEVAVTIGGNSNIIDKIYGLIESAVGKLPNRPTLSLRRSTIEQGMCEHFEEYFKDMCEKKAGSSHQHTREGAYLVRIVEEINQDALSRLSAGRGG